MTDDEVLLCNAVRNAGRTGPRRFRWIAVRDVFAVGSTSAVALCRRFGVDPNETIGVDDEGDA